MMNLPDKQFGNYRLVRLLGEGGSSSVYLGEHCYLNSYAALKLLRVSLSERQAQRFQREAQTLVHLRHPNIIRVLEFSVEQGVPVLVMEYAPNGTLYQRYPRGTSVPLPIVVSYVQQVASALQYIHNKRLIHRDIKPANMLIGEQGQILLSDFGIATASHRTFSQSHVGMAGTVSYMAPEQIDGMPRPASDQYSLAIVVYELLCGNRPFQGPMFQIIQQHKMLSPPPLSEKIPTISSEIEQVVMRALSKDPGQRFSSVLEFAHALEQASLSPPEPITASLPDLTPAPDSTCQGVKSIRPWISRRTLVIGVVVTGSVVSAGYLAWFIPQQSHPTLSPTPDPTPTSTPIPLGKVLKTYRGHAVTVNVVAWSPKGQRIASGSDDKTVQVWNAADGSSPYTYQRHTDIVEAVAWSPKDQRIASGGGDKTVQVWNAADGSSPYTYRGHNGFVYTVAWSPDGKRIASGGGDGTVQVWNAADGSSSYTYRGHTGFVKAVAWSPDGKRIASGYFDGIVVVWISADGSFPYFYQGHVGVVEAVAWSPDGKRIASGGEDGIVQVRNAADGSFLYAYQGHSNFVNTVTWSPDSKRIASGGGDGTVQVWNAIDGSSAYTYSGHHSEVKTVAWSPDGRLIASGGLDKTVLVWGAG